MLKEIKHAFKIYKRECFCENICDANPFSGQQWMYYYLFPECLLVFEDYCKERYLKSREVYFSVQDTINWYSSFTYGAEIYPCWIMSEEQIVRVMAECGIL